MEQGSPERLEAHVHVMNYIDNMTTELVQTPNYAEVYQSLTSNQIKNKNIVKLRAFKNNELKIESKTKKEEVHEFEVDEDDSNDISKSRNEERI